MTTALLLSLLALPATAVSIQDDYLLAEGQHVDGLCWFRAVRACEALPRELCDVGSATWRHVAPWVGVDAGPLERKLLVNLYAKRTEFVSAVEGIQPGASAGVTLWSDWGVRQIHAKVQPILSERTYEDVGVPATTLRGVAEEVARLALLDATEGEALAPRWFVEGLVVSGAQAALVEVGRAFSGVEEPEWSTAIAVCQTLGQEGRLPSVTDLLQDASEELRPAERRALHGIFFAYLAAEGEGWEELGPRVARGLKGEALLAEVDVDGLEGGFATWLHGQRPLWIEAEPALAGCDSHYVQTPLKGNNAVSWSTLPPPEGPYEIRGEFLVYRNDINMGQVNVVLGRVGDDYLSVSFNTQNGVHAWAYTAELERKGEPPFREVTSKALDPLLPSRAWIEFAIRVADERVAIRVGEHELYPFDTTGRPMTGAWGVGTFTGSVGQWRNLEVVPITD
ncbi:MAG: hypothetical protein O2816_04015 [Planctomycetota bacterium]|nr:hypothetical protein [Planctomycetota bacterium]